MSDLTLDCGHIVPGPPQPPTSFMASGYARDDDGLTWCPDCHAAQVRSIIRGMQPDARFMLYVSSDRQHLTTWFGANVMRVTRWGPLHVWSRERHHLTAVDELGRIWSGIGAEGMYSNIRLTKGTA